MIADRSAFANSGYAKLAASLEEGEAIASMDDVELSVTVIEEVLSQLGGRHEMLVAELLGRFEEMAGIDGDEGELTP